MVGSVTYYSDGSKSGSDLAQVNKYYGLSICGILYSFTSSLFFGLALAIIIFYKKLITRNIHFILLIFNILNGTSILFYYLIPIFEIERYRNKFSPYNTPFIIYSVRTGFFLGVLTCFIMLIIFIVIISGFYRIHLKLFDIIEDQSIIVSFDDTVSLIKKLLTYKECEFLDFKYDMYHIFPKNSKEGIINRREFLKDVLGLINNKTDDKNLGEAFIIVGVQEKDDKYIGIYQNINFIKFQSLIDLINEYITPKIVIEFVEYYISGNQEHILLEKEKKEGYNRNIFIRLKYKKGTYYELNRKFGNPEKGVPYYYEGTSFTRDGSHTRRIRKEDIFKIEKISDS